LLAPTTELAFPTNAFRSPVSSLTFPTIALRSPVSSLTVPTKALRSPVSSLTFATKAFRSPVNSLTFPTKALRSAVNSLTFPSNEFRSSVSSLSFPIDEMVLLHAPIRERSFPVSWITGESNQLGLNHEANEDKRSSGAEDLQTIEETDIDDDLQQLISVSASGLGCRTLCDAR
jgi:hypothetical protein